jgi:D-ribose pyranose/furanose isomerase RbsD
LLSADTRLRARGFRSEVVRSPVIVEAVRFSRSVRERASRTLEELGSTSRRIRESELEVLMRAPFEQIKEVRRKAY